MLVKDDVDVENTTCYAHLKSLEQFVEIITENHLVLAVLISHMHNSNQFELVFVHRLLFQGITEAFMQISETL